MTKKIDPKITDLESTIDDLQSKLARALADYQNLEKRFARDSSGIIKFANSNLLGKLLEIRDHLEMAQLHGDKSLQMILSAFEKLLQEEGVVKINTSGVYDPTLMECQETVAGAKDQVISVLRPGYMLHDRVLRPARVTVGSGEDIKKSN